MEFLLCLDSRRLPLRHRSGWDRLWPGWLVRVECHSQWVIQFHQVRAVLPGEYVQTAQAHPADCRDFIVAIHALLGCGQHGAGYYFPLGALQVGTVAVGGIIEDLPGQLDHVHMVRRIRGHALRR